MTRSDLSRPGPNLSRLTRLGCLLALFALLGACATTPPPAPVQDWPAHQRAVAALDTWSLRGRLSIREGDQADTVNLNWDQHGEDFAIRLSSTVLGLGAVYIHGDREQAILEQSGEEPVRLAGLDSLSRDYLGYEFPAAYLLYWVRGLPHPALSAEPRFNDSRLLAELVQQSPAGQTWTLAFMDYARHGEHWLPGLIRMQSQGVRLTFRIGDWGLDAD